MQFVEFLEAISRVATEARFGEPKKVEPEAETISGTGI
jgi:hypothetical protein